ncbi:MAG TPA: glycosyltransferase family 87 protein [Rhizomicrobium sp.]|nr:glycosyltransferase family 87 protein [Rhizomicrobium sp.]
MTGGRGSSWKFASAAEREKLVLTAALAIAFGYVASLALMVQAGSWPVGADGKPIVEDFIAFWVAGKLTLKGAVLAAYDPKLQHAAETALIGHPFSGALGWSYPPLFLFVAVALAQLPYLPAFIAWIALTWIFYAAVAARIARRWTMFAVALAAPWSLTALLPGQNGFLTAALVGLVLLHLEKRPVLAGILLGLLSYKPQFGILFPLALAAGGYWRSFGWAALSAFAANVVSGMVFGFATWSAFAHALSATAETHLIQNGTGWWFKLESAYGLVRGLGGSTGAAWIAQAVVTAMVALAIVWTWRRPIPFARKAALLAAAIPLATPYIFSYDLPILAVAAAFLARDRAFDRIELALLVSTIPSCFALVWVPLPTALFASLAVGAIAVRRVYPTRPRARISPSWATEATSLPSAE